MTKRRGSPDRRGMGAQSDFISETFVPSVRYKAEQMARAKYLLANGFSLDRVAAMLALTESEAHDGLAQPEASLQTDPLPVRDDR